MTPKDEVWSFGKARLWRYQNDDVRYRRPVLLFLGLVGDSTIFDIHPGNSWAERLLAHGFDVFLFDWGRPEAAEGDHSLDVYLDQYLVHAIDAVRRVAGCDGITMGAYCMGALMAVILLGSRADVHTDRLILFAPPCDWEYGPPLVQMFRDGRIAPSDLIDESSGTVSADAVRAMFRLRQPTSNLVQYVTLWEHLWREDYDRGHRAINHWAWSHRAIAGPAFSQLIDEYVKGNALMRGTARLGGRAVEPRRITARTLLVVASRDELVPPECSEPLAGLLGSEDVGIIRVPGGHAGALMGSVAAKITMPSVIDWLEQREASGVV